jgi:PhnB protein
LRREFFFKTAMAPLRDGGAMNDQTQIETVRPRLVVGRPDDAIRFYQAAFGAVLVERYQDALGVVVHAAIRLGSSEISVTQEVGAWHLFAPDAVGGSPVLLTLTTKQPDVVWQKSIELGAVVVVQLAARPYGLREGRMRDPFGHLWIVSGLLERLTPDELSRRMAS